MSSDSEDDNWNDWEDENEEKYECLFCEKESTSVNEILSHMKEMHSTNLKEIIVEESIFYSKF